MLGLIISVRFIHMWQQDGVLLDLKYRQRGVLYVSTIFTQVKKIVPQVEIIQCVVFPPFSQHRVSHIIWFRRS